MKYFKKFWGSVWNSGTTEQCQDPDNDLCWEGFGKPANNVVD